MGSEMCIRDSLRLWSTLWERRDPHPQLIELVEALEEAFSTRIADFRVEDEDLEDLKTVRDAVDYVASRAGL